jgi:sterol desaturase/sphingolipid hydroxylase (fatty acid hydroxylase superfamily)
MTPLTPEGVLNFFRLTRREYYADFFITPPITLAFLVVSLKTSTSMWWPLEFLGGLFAWTFYEYVTHRWVSHRFWFLQDAHFLHHEKQTDYIAIPPAVTVSLYAIFWALFGFQSSSVMLGFSVGYISYSTAHTAFHYARIRPGDFWFNAKRRHALHHKNENENFGVTTPIWDFVFGTYRPAK